MDKEEAIKASRNGAIAALISATLTFAIMVIATQSNVSEELAYFNDPWLLTDVGLLVILAIFVWRRSRVASVLLLAYFLISQILVRFETGNVRGVYLSLIFVYFYIKAIQGAFAFHRISRDEDPDYKAMRLWHLIVGGPVAVAVFGVLVLVLGGSFGIFPATYVQAGDELSQKNIDVLMANNIIEKGDEIEYFYSEGLFSILEGGQLLVQDRVIVYTQNEAEGVDIYEILYDNIESIELLSSGSIFSDAEYRVIGSRGEEWVVLWLSTEDEGDHKFLSALLSHAPVVIVDRTDQLLPGDSN
ncbi:MAG: hypothetical protein EP340_07075 [Alphaproteobacteria bacterium]|nr:MAG: hypothetical protein EP340_07075 [Alphaproteobacteria bacterium]